MRARAAGVPSPIGLLFSPDEWQLVAFNDHILALQMDTHLKIFHSIMIMQYWYLHQMAYSKLPSLPTLR
jgi:hypothetical protein